MELTLTKIKSAPWARMALLFLWLSLLSLKGSAQLYYEVQNYNPAVPPTPGYLGKLFNPQPYLLKSVPTVYYGNQDLYASAYLPFIETEYNQNYPIELFGPNYTTGIVLSSPKDHALGLYAPIQIASLDQSEGNSIYHPFAALIPYDDNKFSYKGPFNILPSLNSEPYEYVHPVNGIAGISALEAMQKFTKFTHDFFGWNGYDKAGNLYLYGAINTQTPESNAEYADSQIFFFKFPGGDHTVNRSAAGHEIAHGIMDHIPAFAGKYFSTSMREIGEGFADIMGLSFYNWTTNPEKFKKPVWNVFPEESMDPTKVYFTFYNQKLFDLPNTYQKTYYEMTNQNADYDVHSNGEVLKYWFYLLNNYQSGNIDDIETEASYTTMPLFPDDIEATYKLALTLVFRTFTEKVEIDTDYPKLRDKTLEMMIEMGYPSTSLQYMLVKNAWYAVGIGEEPDFYSINCGIIKSAESWHNGMVSFSAQEFNSSPEDPNALAYKLLDCTTASDISTAEYMNNLQGAIEFWDAENDGIYGIDNDLEKSKSAVSVHTFTIEARNWYKNKFNHDGPDGSGLRSIDNILGDNSVESNTYDKQNNIFNYNYSPESCTIDKVSNLYFTGINSNVKNESVTDVIDYSHPEWHALRKGLGRIFTLNIKNDFKSALPVPQAPVWTIGEDLPNSSYFIDLSNPTLTLQPSLYHGLNWNDIYPDRNFSLITYMYYLLVHGTSGGQGYTNELGHTYFIFPMDNDLALQVIWKTYLQAPLFSDFEEFRLASLETLHTLGYSDKSKEHIALYDAWAAVMDMPDYASNLKHEPADGETIYPWAAQLGVEVEYPLLESSRLFQVSESATFNEQTAPVYSFFSYVAPDLNTGMTYGRVNLTPGKTYFVRSHLYGTGAKGIGLAGGCEGSPDPNFCFSLQGKEKWTPTYSFKTAEVNVSNLSPAANTLAPAWDTPMSWDGTVGAEGYLMKIADHQGLAPEQEITIDEVYDVDEPLVQYNLALSKGKDYTWALAAKAKSGSPEGVKIVANPLLDFSKYEPLTPAEKTAFPDVYGTSSAPITFKTDVPKVVLGNPAEGTPVSMIGSITLAASPHEPRVDFFRGRIYFKQDGEQPNNYMDVDVPAMNINVQNLPFLEDGHTYGWTFAPKKKATTPFIPKEETGEMPAPKHFVVQKKLIPEPVLIPKNCVQNGMVQTLSWNMVAGATGYQYSVKNLSTNVVIASGITDQLQSPAISGASIFPNKYEWKVSAGIKDVNGDWNFGKEASSTYIIAPPAPTGLSPNNQQSVTLGVDQSLTFSWTPVAGVNQYRLKLFIGNSQVKNMVVDFPTVTIKNLDFDTNYHWELQTLNPLDITCTSDATTGTFTTEKNSMVPELGFNFSMVDCNKAGVCLPDITYNITVKAPNGNLVYSGVGLNSNTSGVTYTPNSNMNGNGVLPIQDGMYTVTVILTNVGSDVINQPSAPAWLFNAKVMNIAPIINNQGPAQELDAMSKAGNVNPITGTLIKFKFEYTSNNVQ